MDKISEKLEKWHDLGLNILLIGENLECKPKNLLNQQIAGWLIKNKPDVVKFLRMKDAPTLKKGDKVKILQRYGGEVCEILDVFDDGESIRVKMPNDSKPPQILLKAWNVELHTNLSKEDEREKLENLERFVI